MMTPPLSISAMPRLTRAVPVTAPASVGADVARTSGLDTLNLSRTGGDTGQRHYGRAPMVGPLTMSSGQRRRDQATDRSARVPLIAGPSRGQWTVTGLPCFSRAIQICPPAKTAGLPSANLYCVGWDAFARDQVPLKSLPSRK